MAAQRPCPPAGTEAESAALESALSRRGWARAEGPGPADADLLWGPTDGAAVGAALSRDALVKLQPGALVNHFPDSGELTQPVGVSISKTVS
jgi:hypothetical protein